jgi:DNA polymerase III epsilon subunit family exonuclease
MSFSLLQPLCELPLAFVDTETTGVSPEFGHRVIEVGIVRVHGGQVVAEYQQLIDPRRPISPGVVELTGISNDMVAGQPTFMQQLPMATELLRNAIIVGHNVRFDLSFLHHEFRCCGQQMADCFPGAMVLDTLQLARRRFGRGGNGLQRLARRLGVSPTTAHRALADAQTTYQVFEKMIDTLAGWQTSLADLLITHGNPLTLTVTRESLLPLALEEALDQRKAVMMEYLDARAQRTQRIIQPLHVRRFRGELVLVGHCQLRDSQRTFKVERIVQLTRMEDLPIPNATVEIMDQSTDMPPNPSIEMKTPLDSLEPLA